MSFVPAHLVEQAPGATPDRTAFFLHGILGSARNWRTFARQLVRRHPRWRVVLVDLRNHGDSTGAPPPHTLASAAADLVALGDHLGAHPEIVVGHSFGGKVGLVYARDHGVSQLWVLDAVPGAGGRPDGEVVAVLGALRDLAMPVARREEVAKALLERGFSTDLATWMTTNLKPVDGGYDWRFDLDAIEAMIADYWEQDLFPFLERGPGGPVGSRPATPRFAGSPAAPGADAAEEPATDAGDPPNGAGPGGPAGSRPPSPRFVGSPAAPGADAAEEPATDAADPPNGAGAPGEVHLVRAGRSDRWTPDVLERLEHLSPRVHVHVLPDSGHWVHVDDPQGLMALLDQGFGE